MSLGREAPATVPSLRTDFWSEGTSSFVSVTIPAPHGCKGEVGGVANRASESGWSMSSTFSQCDLGRSPWSTCWWLDYPLLPVIAGWSWESV